MRRRRPSGPLTSSPPPAPSGGLPTPERRDSPNLLFGPVSRGNEDFPWREGAGPLLRVLGTCEAVRGRELLMLLPRQLLCWSFFFSSFLYVAAGLALRSRAAPLELCDFRQIPTPLRGSLSSALTRGKSQPLWKLLEGLREGAARACGSPAGPRAPASLLTAVLFHSYTPLA